MNWRGGSRWRRKIMRKAVAELEQANQQNPQNLYRLSQAYRGQGDYGEGAGVSEEGGGIQFAAGSALCVRSGEGVERGGQGIGKRHWRIGKALKS